MNKISDIIAEIEELDKVSEEIRELILKQKFPEDLRKEILDNYNKLKSKKVAVRSSATAEDLPTASFAGQQDTYLNVSGEKNIIVWYRLVLFWLFLIQVFSVPSLEHRGSIIPLFLMEVGSLGSFLSTPSPNPTSQNQIVRLHLRLLPRQIHLNAQDFRLTFPKASIYFLYLPGVENKPPRFFR